MNKKRKGKSDLMGILQQHFEDDKENFDRLGEILRVNGEHISYFNKNLVEIREELKKEADASARHRQRTEVMINSYEKDVEFNKELSEKTLKWGKRLTWAAGVIAALLYLRWFITKLLV